MQATSTMKRFAGNRAGAMAVALSIAIGGVIGVTAFAIGNDASQEFPVESARVMPNAYTSAGQGEGLVDAANLRVAADAPHKAFTSLGQGEGLIDGTNGSLVRTTVKAYLGHGQGEGLVGPGGSLDRSLIESSSAPLKAFTSPGQGEGLIDPANRTIETNGLKAYTSPGQGEGLVGPGGSAGR